MDWLSGLLGGILSGVQQGFQNKFNANEAQKQRDFQSREAEITRAFNSSESALQRDWSSQEAERARDWQEEMNAKYNSISGKISQAEQAGVNPMFAVTGNAVSPVSASGSVPSGSAASVGMPSGASATGSLVDLVGNILGLSKLKAEVENIQADSAEKKARASKQEKETSWIDQMSEAQLKNLITSTDELESRIHVNDETANKLSSEANKLVQEGLRISKITDAEVRKTEAEAIIAEYESSVAKIMNGQDIDYTDIVSAASIWLERLLNLAIRRK